jgi:WD40 repeat protein
VLHWTGGHPYLTQRLCQAVAELNPKSEIRNPKSVDRVCAELFLSHRAQERDDNLLFVRERLLRGETDLAGLLDLYAQVRSGKRVADEVTNPLVGVLRLSGITRVEQGVLRVRNRIYERVFDRAWVTANMPDAELRRQRAAYRKGLLRASAVAVVIIAVIAGLTIMTIQQRNRADRNERLANLKADEARRALAEAVEQRKQAEAQKTEAENQKQKAEEQKVVADEQRQAAVTQQMIAQAREKDKQSLLYIANMKLAQDAWYAHDPDYTLDLIKQYLPGSGQEDAHGFEWYYLWRLVHAAQFALPSSAPLVGSTMAFSPDGAMLGLAYPDGTVKVWDARNRRELITLRTGVVHCLAISHDGKMLAAGANNKPVKLWELATGREIAALSEPIKVAAKIGFSDDDRQLISWSVTFQMGAISGMEITWWDIATRWALVSHRFEGGSGATNLSPSLTLFARSAREGIKLWDAQTFQELVTFKPDSPVGTALVFSLDGKRLAGAGGNGTVQVWDATKLLDPATSKKEPLLTLRTQVHQTIKSWALAFSPDNRQLVTISEDRSLQLWDLTTGQEVLFQGSHTAAEQVAFSPDGRQIAAVGNDRLVKLWDVTRPPEPIVFQGHEGIGNTLAFSSDSRLLAATNNGHAIRLVELATGKEQALLKGHTGRIDALAFSPDGKWLATAGNDLTIRLWDVAARRVTHTFRAHAGTVFVSGLAFSPDGKRLASTALDDETKRGNHRAVGCRRCQGAASARRA